MAEVLEALIARLKDYRSSLPDLIAEVIEENKTLIEDLNIQQLQRGERADGAVLPDYAESSVMKYGKPPGPIKLFDSGAFYKGITARVRGNALDMDNTDSKIGKLANRFGDEIIGLQEQNVEYLQMEILVPQMIIKTEQKLLQ